jgi:hypothetical protein
MISLVEGTSGKWPGGRRGRKNSQITGIRTSESELMFEPEKMAETFAEQFFAKDPGPIPTTFDRRPGSPTDERVEPPYAERAGEVPR